MRKAKWSKLKALYIHTHYDGTIEMARVEEMGGNLNLGYYK